TAANLATQPTLATTATAASHVGSYAITASGAASSDYTIRYVGGSLNVTPAPLRITAEDKSKVYRAELVPLTAAYDGLVNGYTPPTRATTATAASHVGSYSITASGAADSDYAIEYVAGHFAVTSAPLTITADDKSKSVGSPIPPLTFTPSGFVNGDTTDSLTTQPTLSTTATSASPAGTYPINGSGAAGPAYKIPPIAGNAAAN